MYGERKQTLCRLAAVLAAALALCSGCRPLVGVRVVVPGEQTELERRVLGSRQVVRPQTVMLPLGAPPRTEQEKGDLTSLREAYLRQLERRRGAENTPESRLWEAITLHNAGVVSAALGERDRADSLLEEAGRLCETCMLPAAQWQTLLALSVLRGGQDERALLEKAAGVLENAVFLTELERNLWNRRAANELYSRLVAISLAENDPETALVYAERRRAVQLAFALEPGTLTLPQGELGDLLERLGSAKERLAVARRKICGLPAEGPAPGTAETTLHEELRQARDAVLELRSAIRQSSPAGGLLVPAPADVYAAQELLARDTALLMVEPVGADRFVVFLLAPEVFEAKRVELAPGLAAQASADSALRTGFQTALSQFSAGVLGPFEEHLGDGVRRLYVLPPAELSAAAWQSLPLRGQPLCERFQVAFAGSLADLTASFSAKSYGRRSLLLCHGWPDEPQGLSAALMALEHASPFDLARSDRAAFQSEAAFHDFFWFSNPVLLRSGQPSQSYLAFPGPLGVLSGLGVGELCALDTSASLAGFRDVVGAPWSGDSYLGLRVFTRALTAAGIPAALYSTGLVPEAAAARFWKTCLETARDNSAGEAHRAALSEVAPGYRPQFRLYGFLGMTPEEYVENSRLEFSDLFRTALSHVQDGRLSKAASAFLDLWDMAQVLELPQVEDRAIILANLQQHLVNCWTGLREYDLAARHQQHRIDYLKGHPGVPESALAAEHQTLGALLTKAERFQAATDAYQKALELLAKEGEEQQVARLLGELGKSQDRAAHYADALASFRQALERYQRLNSPEGVAQQLQRMGAIHLRRLSDPHRAEGCFRQALEVFKAAQKSQDAVGVQIDIGLCRRRVGDFEAALRLFTEALAASRSAAFRGLEARALAEIANTHWLQGRYQAALDAVKDSNEIAEELDLPFRLNVNYQLLGLIYWELNQYGRAHAALDEAVQQARRAEQPLEVASALNNRGIIYRRQQEYERALSFFRQALELDARLLSRWGQGYDHRNIGITLHRLGKLQEAAGHLQKAVDLSTEINDAVNLARALFNLGDLRLTMGEPDRAETLLKGALDKARQIHLPEVEWRALRALGTLYRKRGDRERALQMFKEGVGVVEGMRGRIKTEEFRSGFLSNKMDLYEDTVSLLLELGRSAEAFTYAERSRARRFIDVIDGQALSLRTEHERELYEKQAELGGEITALGMALARETDADRRRELAEELAGLRAEYAELLGAIRAANPQLARLVSVEATEPGELYDVLEEDAALLVYYLMERQIAIWVIRNRSLRLYATGIDREALSRKVKDFRLMIQNRELLADVKRSASELYRELIAPVEQYIDGAAVVGIVPHRALHYLSFASLYDGEAYLVERMPLFYLPSASVLPHLLEDAPDQEKAQAQVLAVANPAVGNRAYELPFTEKEAQSVGRDFSHATQLLGSDATESRLMQNAPEADVIHVGAHGRFDELHPLLSALLLAPDEKQDGSLELHEVTGLRLSARLVTLSACQSGLGTLGAADELVSLSRAFIYAGTRAILSTLWRVDDLSTALLSKHFYRHYVEHGKAESLRHAQLRVMNDGRHYHPTYWAGMVLTGDYR